MEYEFAYNDSAVHRFNHYTTRRTLPSLYNTINVHIPKFELINRLDFFFLLEKYLKD